MYRRITIVTVSVCFDSWRMSAAHDNVDQNWTE